MELGSSRSTISNRTVIYLDRHLAHCWHEAQPGETELPSSRVHESVRQWAPLQLSAPSSWAPRLVKTPLLRTSGLIGQCCWQHPNTKLLLVERPHARCYLNKTRTWIKVLAVATIDAAIQWEIDPCWNSSLWFFSSALSQAVRLLVAVKRWAAWPLFPVWLGVRRVTDAAMSPVVRRKIAAKSMAA